MIGYMDNIKNVRINLSETIFNPLGNEKSETIKTPLNKDLSETYGIYFNPNYIWKDGAVLDNENVIQDGLSAYVISMAIIHSMQGYYNISKISPCKIYLDKDISLIVKKCENKHDSLCLILRNSDGKILSLKSATNSDAD